MKNQSIKNDLSLKKNHTHKQTKKNANGYFQMQLFNMISNQTMTTYDNAQNVLYNNQDSTLMYLIEKT